MATRAVLPEEARSCILRFFVDNRGGMAFVRFRVGWLSLRSRLRERNRRAKQYEEKQDRF